MQQKKPREKSKTRAWEKERRNRLNDGFTKLSQVLPSYDSSKTFSKIEILEHAKLAIKDLDEKLKKFLCPQEADKGEAEKIKGDIIKKLQDRIKKLLVRNEQLSNLLRNAGITVPREYSAVKKFTRRYKDTYKLSEDQIKAVQKELEKENQMNVLKPKKPRDSKLKKNSSLKSKKFSKKEQISKLVSSPNCVFIVSQPNLINNSCYIIAKNSKKGNQTMITNSVFLKQPIVSSNIKPSIITANSTTNLGPGTLILTNGTVMPVVPTPQTLPILPAILNPIQNRVSTLIVVSSCSTKTTCTSKIAVSTAHIQSTKDMKPKPCDDSIYSNIRPIIRPKTCLTKTTQVNKVPIPALSSKINSHFCINNSSIITKTKSIKPNENESSDGVKNKNKRKLSEGQNTEKKIRSETESAKRPEELSIPSSSDKDGDTVLQADDPSIRDDKVKGSPAVNSEPINESKAVLNQNSETVANHRIESSIPEILQVPVMPESEAPTLVNVTKHCNKLPVSKEKGILDTSTILAESSLDKNHQKNGTVDSTVRPTTNITSPDLNAMFDPSMSKTQYSIPTMKTTNLAISKYESQSLQVTKDLNESPELKQMEISLPQSELSNDLFASLQVPSGCQNPESTSPTAAFLLAFPLVSSGVKVTEVEGEDNAESHAGTPNLLQIGTMDSTKATQSHAESLTPSLLNLDSFSFFSNKDSCGGFYNNYNMVSTAPSCNVVTTSTVTSQNTSFVDNVSLNDGHSKRKSDKIVENSSCRNYGTENVASLERKPAASLNRKSIKETNFNVPSQCSNITNSGDQHNPQVHSNSFQAKSLVNTNFSANKVKNDILEPYNSKSFDNSGNYLNYKDCSSLTQNTFNSNKNFNPAYTIAGTNNYFYNSYGSEGDRNYNMSQCENYPDYRKSEHFLNNYNDPQINHGNVKLSGSQNKLINWMTTPSTTSTSSYKTDYFLPPFSKDNDFSVNLNPTNTFNTVSSNVHFSSASVYSSSDYLNHGQDLRKPGDITLPTYNNYQRPETEDNQFSWSPNKMPQFFDAAHSFVSATLPTLVGDLALNNTSGIDSSKNTVKERNKENRRKMSGYDNHSGQSNFLSVSQLVERETVPGKISSRRNSGNRSKNNPPKKRVANKGESNKDLSVFHKTEKVHQSKNYASNNVNGSVFCDPKHVRNNKMIPSSYSAEALIGNQMSADGAKKNVPGQNKPLVSSFLSDNIMPYFPTVDVPQENTYMQPNQTYQTNTFSHNFTSFQNNSYGTNNIIPNACAISTTYIPNNNFMHSANGQDGFQVDNSNIFQNANLSSNKDKNSYARHYSRTAEKEEKNETISCKKAKKRTLTESNLPTFEIPFLSLPGPINSPILPDDFHTTYLPSSTLYPCKNPLYSKTTTELTPSSLMPPLPSVPPNRTSIQHPEISPSVNSVGTSLTNFNLSAIFPEINKGPIHEPFSDVRNKDYSIARNFPVTSSIQVPFTSKSSITFGSFGT